MLQANSEGCLLAVAAGALGAVSGLVAKLGLDQEQLASLPLNPLLLAAIRGLLLLATLATNGCMLAVYSRALVKSSTSAEASLLSTGGNLAVTALVSNLVLSEPVSLSWVLGSVLILAGSYLVVTDPPLKPTSLQQ